MHNRQSHVSTPATAYADAPWTFAKEWGATGHIVDLGEPVHFIDFGGQSDLPPVVLVHGLGGSHLNWALVGPALAADRRVVALDLAGFGLTFAGRRRTTVQSNAKLLSRFIKEVVGGPAIVVGNSMGGMVTILLAAAEPDLVAGAVLLDPSVPVQVKRPDRKVAQQFLTFALPGVGEIFMKWSRGRMTSRQQVQQTIDLCFADPSLADPAVVDAGVALADERRKHRGIEASFLEAARSLMFVLARSAAYKKQIKSLQMPVLLIHGELDRLVAVDAARQTAAESPGWRAVFMPGVGHTPMLEVPDLVIQSIRTFFEDHAVLMGSA